MRTIAL
jgi:hypothetical protein